MIRRASAHLDVPMGRRLDWRSAATARLREIGDDGAPPTVGSEPFGVDPCPLSRSGYGFGDGLAVNEPPVERGESKGHRAALR